MRPLTCAEHLAAEHLAAAYRGARAFVAALNDVPPYAVRECAQWVRRERARAARRDSANPKR